MTTALPRRALLGGSAALLAAPALAQSFPQRPIRFISPFPAGGIIDLVIRACSDDLAAELGQPVVVDVRTGAGGMIAAQNLAQSPPDGHSWLLASLGHIVAPLLTPQTFHPVESFQGLTRVSHAVSVIAVPAGSPLRSMAELIAAARAEPGRLNYLRPGSGSFAHMAAEVIQRAQGIRLTAVDYRGLPPGVVDLIAGRLGLALDLDQASLAARGIAPGEIVRAEVEKASRDRLLDAVLQPVGLEWKIEGERLRVFAAEPASSEGNRSEGKKTP
jgi:tripartite-type tricarboxylate transporter receptor subunit TctC